MEHRICPVFIRFILMTSPHTYLPHVCTFRIYSLVQQKEMLIVAAFYHSSRLKWMNEKNEMESVSLWSLYLGREARVQSSFSCKCSGITGSSWASENALIPRQKHVAAGKIKMFSWLYPFYFPLLNPDFICVSSLPPTLLSMIVWWHMLCL